ncbi:MAG TPA: amylo-alpha-1,6-glucosidase [Verrucomicrobiae bacterium]|nr:amylo-alpha-1,6-glucosidase [Verrucomicrobiae bacterium]
MEQSTLSLTPAPGERLVRFVGDQIRFTLRDGGPCPKPARTDDAHRRWRGLLRTNLGRGSARRREIIAAHAGGVGHAGTSWHDMPMKKNGGVWEIELPLAEVGFFKAKPYLLDAKGWQHWPDGPDVGISVHPDFCRTANVIYCAFTRLFGVTRTAATAVDAQLNFQLNPFDAQGYAVIPPSGKLRDLARQLPHIVQTLGCRILHLLPVHPTPTTYARFGRFGSPYAALDLTAIDPALAEFDHRTTAIDQFCELTSAAHALGALVFLDVVINHTGWGAVLQENHPEFFLRNPDGTFASPGAWGITWGDLVELKQDNVALWDIIAGALLTWCRRGVDGFRCDAGYKIPVPAWQYIIARVQEEFPETVFLLEGLGGSWEATENLLTEGGMQWAYSELFQNHSGPEVANYLDHALHPGARGGLYVHYSETHDNDRLAKRGRAWSLLRNRLCALTSLSGGFGFTCGVEWLAAEKIKVHDCTGLSWDSPDNIVPELARLNQLLADHPCFFDGAKLTRLSASDSPVYALLRESAEGKDSMLVLVNTDVEKEQSIVMTNSELQIPNFEFELLGQSPPKAATTGGKATYTLPAGACYCLAPTSKPLGLSGDDYRRARAQAAWAAEVLNKVVPAEISDGFDWRRLAEQVERSPKNFLAAAAEFAVRSGKTPLSQLLSDCETQQIYPRVARWTLLDHRRITPVPPGHWLLIEDSAPFRAALEVRHRDEPRQTPQHARSIFVRNSHIACFPPQPNAADAELVLERYSATSQRVSAAVRFLTAEPESKNQHPKPGDLVLLTNGIGGMARLCVDLGRVNSKYDCVLGANLDPRVPVDRHVFVKRTRAWVNADGFISPLDAKNLSSFTTGSPAVWQFVADAGDGRTVEIELRAEMLEGKNTTVFQFNRPTAERAMGKQLPADADVRLTVRFDIEDRNFHWETKRNGGADYHFSTNTHELQTRDPKTKAPIGFAFTPAADRQLRVLANTGEYHPQPEWCENIPHPVEQSRGLAGSGDAYSPGWFEIPLPKGANVTLVVTAEPDESPQLTSGHPLFSLRGEGQDEGRVQINHFERRLLDAAKQFVVRRDPGKTVIAGYPWFLDWGRDTLVCARGLLAAGMTEDVRQILLTFAKFEQDGTLPNAIYGDNASNRDTSDAPLWLAMACADFSEVVPHDFYSTPVDARRTIRDVLASIAQNYSSGTPNGIRMDADSALIWSPSHFTWMDTNHPAGTPREGYPVEIQALWIRLLRQLEQHSTPAEQKKWGDLANRAAASLEKLFWLEERGWFADVLFAESRVLARDAAPSDALRSNCLFPVSLGLATGERAKRCVEAAQTYLLVPGALRTLAPLPVSVPLPIHGNSNGELLNNPAEPYWPRYECDEDTRRKPAYHNGTAWTWTFPHFCEALARAWDFAPEAVVAAKVYLGSMEQLMNEGCLGQIPEILDGDAPHTQRGCDAQAWGVTETLRVWKLLNSPGTRAE